jgi:transcriptional regulator with XRE-family HTH domain
MGGSPFRRASAGLRNRVGDNLAALRRARGLSQLELAALCGCDNNSISKIENGRKNSTLATLEMLAGALNCCESDLLSRWPTEPGGVLPATVDPESRALTDHE